MHSCSAVLAILKYNDAYAHLYTAVLLRVYTIIIFPVGMKAHTC